MLSMLGDEYSIGRALDAGAKGYVLKNADQGEAVAAGKTFLSDSQPEPSKVRGQWPQRSEREALQFIVVGLTNGEKEVLLAFFGRLLGETDMPAAGGTAFEPVFRRALLLARYG